MTVDPLPVARMAALFADPTRMTICLALIDGRAWTAGELARHAKVSPPTATAHLNELVAAGLLSQERQGRHRYLRLAGPSVAQLIEDLATAAGLEVIVPTSLRTSRVSESLGFARTCYDHLAGRLGVGVMDAMVERGLLKLSAGPALTPDGEVWLTALAGGAAHTTSTRPVVRPCLDWTERRPHLGGLAGAVVCFGFAARGWTRQREHERFVTVTPEGDRGIADLLGLDVHALRSDV
ncbi:MAG: winged helix-turn-helix domain-containing protein [Nocardioidaceae bacterium]